MICSLRQNYTVMAHRFKGAPFSLVILQESKICCSQKATWGVTLAQLSSSLNFPFSKKVGSWGRNAYPHVWYDGLLLSGDFSAIVVRIYIHHFSVQWAMQSESCEVWRSFLRNKNWETSTLVLPWVTTMVKFRFPGLILSLAPRMSLRLWHINNRKFCSRPTFWGLLICHF